MHSCDDVEQRLTPFKVQEGVFLYARNVSPYDGGVFHQVAEDFSAKSCLCGLMEV